MFCIKKSHFFHSKINFPIHLNAGVLEGPGGKRGSIDGKQFIDETKRMNKLVLSLGWIVDSSANPDEAYKKEHIEAMQKVLKDSKINTEDYKDVPLNFHIEAYYALKSKDVLTEFYNSVKKTNPMTYTIHHQNIGDVKVEDLQAFITSYGVGNMYVDLPDDLRKKLKLGDPGSKGGASSVVQFGLLNLITLAVITVLRN